MEYVFGGLLFFVVSVVAYLAGAATGVTQGKYIGMQAVWEDILTRIELSKDQKNAFRPEQQPGELNKNEQAAARTWTAPDHKGKGGNIKQ